MDAHTLELLEFAKVRELLAGYVACALGKELALQIEPLADADRIRAELALVSEMVDALGQGLSPPFAGLHDVRLTVRRAAIGAMLTAEQLLEIADTLTCTGNMYRYRMRLTERHTKLIEMLTSVEDLGHVAKSITGCIDGRGHVLDMASRELAQIRQKLTNVDDRVQNHIRRLLRDPQLRAILRYPNATVNGDHYVLPVAVNHRHKIQGVVHRTSSTGETVFVEPAGVAALSAERTILKGEEEREVRRILRRLAGDVAKVAKPLGHAIDVLARLDLVTAKARYSRDFNMFAPDISTDGQLWLRNARHPLLEHLFREEARTAPPGAEPRKVVPIELRLGYSFKLLIITGPNTGGKTVCLKTAGLLSLMALSGMHVPAGEGSSVPLFRNVFADIGDEQSLQQSLSTFSSHITRIGHILKNANADTLVVLDELGAGTDPTEGAALGRAILDSLDSLACLAMVTTHLGDLKTYAFNNERAENGAAAFDVETLRPTYKLEIGQFGMSNALKIARRLKLPRDLLQRAHRYLRRRQKRAPEMAQLQRLREETEKARGEALAAQHEAERQAEELRRRMTEIQRKAEEETALRESRLKLVPGDSVRVPKFDKVGKVVRTDFKKNVAVVSVGIGQWEVPLEEVFPEGK
jgi:DNA mismatch repair protein MutS2